uniref:Uncharacterized protein n=1 Tax=Populus trichocarpa TaxID=3694 RepID=B9HUD1_POPTR
MHSMLSKPKFYITLVRGIPGTRRLHRRAVEASVQPDFHARCTRPINKNEVNHQAVLAPLVVDHLPASASASS